MQGWGNFQNLRTILGRIFTFPSDIATRGGVVGTTQGPPHAPELAGKKKKLISDQSSDLKTFNEYLFFRPEKVIIC